MDDIEESLDSSVIQEHRKGNFFTSTDVTCAPLNQEEKCSSKHLSDSTDATNAVENEVQERHANAKQEMLSVQENESSSPDELDHHVPCRLETEITISPSSPIAGLVPITNISIATPTQIPQEQNPVPERGDDSSEKEVFTLSESSSVGPQFLKYTSGEEIGNYHFVMSQDQGQGMSDDDSCDASYLQGVNNAVNSFNEQYQDRREENGSFSPEAFLSSIPLFKKLRKKRPAAILPKPDTTDPSDQYEHYLTGSHGVPILPKTKPDSTVLIHDSGHGVPIAPRPNPNTTLSCYVLVVPTPVYYENFVPDQESLQLQQEHQEDMSATVPSEPQDEETEIEATADVTTQVPDPVTMQPPDWTPKPPKLARTPLPSTRVRVSPSPHKNSNRCSPLITVSTTTTPIPALQGNKQQYVIVQGNHRHLKGLASYKDSFCTPTIEGSHQPIYLQGLPPQGFRRLWKAKENACTENPTKRSLEPLFTKASASVSQEAIVPQMEKSPLTCIRDKIPCDREVPEPNSSTSPDEIIPSKETPDVSASTPAVEATIDQDTVDVTESEFPENRDQDQPLESENEKIDEVTIIPISQVKGREDKERKKIRDRKYDADLKKAFEQLRRVVPRIQKSYSRGLILQETIKYIGILEKKVLGAGLRLPLQTQDLSEQNNQSISVSEEAVAKEAQESVTETEHVLSPMASSVPDMSGSVTSTMDETPTMLPEDERGLNPQENPTAALTSPIVLSLSTDEGPCSFVSTEGAVITIDCEDPNGDTLMIEEVPLSLPFQQIQLLPVNDATHVLTPQSPDEPFSQEPHTRLIPVVEVPGYTENCEHLGVSHGEHISPLRDVFLNAMTTISHEGLSDLGVTLSPLLSPLGILLSPGGDYNQEPTIAVVVEDASSAIEEGVVVSSGVMPGICTDMTSIAASVEITTDQRKKRASPSCGRTRRSPRLREAQTVPSLSPLQAGACQPSTPHSRNRRVLQDHSNFEVPMSPVGGNGRGRRRKSRDGSPEQSFHNADENSAFAANQTSTPPGRVSGVILSGRRKTPNSRGRVDTKRFRRF